MEPFEFATANRIIFGSGSITRLDDAAAQYGKKALIVHGYPDWEAVIRENLGRELAEKSVEFANKGEPNISSVMEAAEQVRRSGADLVIGMGGGSAIDTAKAAAAMATNPGDLRDYLEVIGAGKKLDNDPLPVIAIPTTAGTGSEVTRNAVVGSPEESVKVSLRHKKMLPRVAIVDPTLTLGLPAEVTAYTGMDALVQVIEPLVSRKANPITDSLCREGIWRAQKSLQKAHQDGEALEYREDMALVSLFGGLALANAKLGAVHGIAGPFGGMYPAPHGAICGRLLAPIMRQNIAALKSSGAAPEILERYQEIARLLTGDPEAEPEDGVCWIAELVHELDIPTLSAYGFVPAAIDAVVVKAQASSSMKGNPVDLSDAALAAALREAMEQG